MIVALEKKEVVRFALEISRGMQHLESKGIIHRDLAARNVLLSTNLTLKVMLDETKRKL